MQQKKFNFIDGSERDLRIGQIIDSMHNAYKLIVQNEFGAAADELHAASMVAESIVQMDEHQIQPTKIETRVPTTFGIMTVRGLKHD